MIITWVLQSFNTKELNSIAHKIIEKTNNTIYYNISRIFTCETKSDIDIIYSILTKYYYDSKPKEIDFVTPAIHNFISDNDVWQ